MKKTIIAAIAVAMAATAQAKERFYDSKSQIISVTGHVGELASGGFGAKMFYNDIDFEIDAAVDEKGRFVESGMEGNVNSAGLGRKILDYLFMWDGRKMSEELLKQRAWENVQQNDWEIASAGIKDAATVLREDYLPILQNQYVFFQRTSRAGRTAWIVLKAEITKETFDAVFAAWDNPQLYGQIAVPVKAVASGEFKDDADVRNKLLREVSKKVPAFAIRGQVTGPRLGAAIGLEGGIRPADRLVVYRQVERDGVMRSKKVCTTRAVATINDSTRLYTIAGGFASHRKGDMAVLQQDKRMSLSFTGAKQGHAYGGGVAWDWTTSFHASGISWHTIAAVEASVMEGFGKDLYEIGGKVYYPPFIFDFGAGLAMGYTFAHKIQLQPYFLAQMEMLYFSEKTVSKTAYDNGDYTSAAYSLNLPIGLKASINLHYPVQLTLGAEYRIVAYKFNPDDGQDIKYIPYKTVDEDFLKPIGFSRSGLNVYGGIRICF